MIIDERDNYCFLQFIFRTKLFGAKGNKSNFFNCFFQNNFHAKLL